MDPAKSGHEEADDGQTSFLYGVAPSDLSSGELTEQGTLSGLLPSAAPGGPSAPATEQGTAAGVESLGMTPQWTPGAAETVDESGGSAAFEIPQPVEGEVFLGRYLVERRIGAGGMGTVWLVNHLTLGIPRALKLITAGVATDPDVRARFRREARVMARLSHPHAVTVHDARLAVDAAFIEMEYIRGKSLAQLLTPGVPMPREWTARVVEQLCDVLQAAHENEVVHRDLKPSNLMLLDDRPPGREYLKVLDFGIAKILGGNEGDPEDLSTRTGAALFTPQYASPEQVMGVDVDTRSDIYSVGVILYEFLTGYRPFTGPGVTYSHLNIAPPTFFARNPAVSVPHELESLVLRCLAKRPEDRPQSARDLWEEFRQAIARAGWDVSQAPHAHAHDGGSTRTVADPDSPTHAYAPDTGQTTRILSGPQAGVSPARTATALVEPARAVAPPRRRRWPWALLAASCLLGLGTYLGWGAWGKKPKDAGMPAGYAAEGPADAKGSPTAIVRGDGTRFVRIQGGEFAMGEDPARPVVVSDYYLQEAEVTNGELEAYFRREHVKQDHRPRRWRERYTRIEDQGIDPKPLPAVGISHEVAERYAHSVGGRLPTEAEWEYAARSRGGRRKYVWGDAPRPGPKVANVDSAGEHASEVVAAKTYPKDRTEQGVYDLSGNVREWCQDVFAPYPSTGRPEVDPEGPPRTSTGQAGPFVIRGGSFLSWSDESSTTGPRQPPEKGATATDLAEDGSARDLGFRVVIPSRRR